MAHRVRPRESGCPNHKKQLLPVLVVWAPPRKKRNQEQHALNGNTSPSAAGSPARSVRQRNDCDLEPTLVLPATAPGAAADGPGRLHIDLEARLFTRGRELAGTLVRSGQTAHPDDGSRMAQQARYCAARILPARRAHPETVGLHAGRGGEHPLGSRRELAHTGPQWCALHLPRVLLADLRRGFSRRLLCGVSRRRWWRWKVSSVNWKPPRGETVTRSCSGWLAGWRTTPQWLRSGSSTSVRLPPPWTPPTGWGRRRASPWVPVGRHQMFRTDAERPLRETSRTGTPLNGPTPR